MLSSSCLSTITLAFEGHSAWLNNNVIMGNAKGKNFMSVIVSKSGGPCLCNLFTIFKDMTGVIRWVHSEEQRNSAVEETDIATQIHIRKILEKVAHVDEPKLQKGLVK